jgi:GDPmannose 4,6-dehydratase
MWKMLQISDPETFVIATGISRSVREFVETALEIANLPGDVEKYVTYDKSLVRPSEVDSLVGDYSKARNSLGWEPKTSFKKMLEIMIENDLKIEHGRL